MCSIGQMTPSRASGLSERQRASILEDASVTGSQISNQNPSDPAENQDSSDPAKKLTEWQGEFQQMAGPMRESLLRNKAAFSQGLKPNFGHRGGVSIAMLEERKNIRDIRKGRHPVEIIPNQTVDTSMTLFLKLEAGALAVDSAAAALQGVYGPLSATGFAAELSASLFGVIPECALLYKTIKESNSAQARLTLITQLKEKIDEIISKIDSIISKNADIDTGPFNKLKGEYLKFKEGLEPMEALQHKIIEEAKQEKKAIWAGVGGGVTSAASAGFYTAGEITEQAAYTTVGASAGVVAAPLAMVFQVKNIIEEVDNVQTFQENKAKTIETLEKHPSYRSDSTAGEANSLTRALAKMAQTNSSVKDAKLRAGLYSTGLLASATSTVQSGLLLAGATTAATTVGVVAVSLLGVAVLGFVGYGIYKWIKSKRSSTVEMQKAAFHSNDSPPKKLLDLARIQTLKTKNDVTRTVLREGLRKPLEQIQQKFLNNETIDTDDTSLIDSLKSALQPLPDRVANLLAKDIITNLPKKNELVSGVDLQQNPYAPNPEFQALSREDFFQKKIDESVNRTLESFVAGKNKAHIALLADDKWKEMIAGDLSSKRTPGLQNTLQDALPVTMHLPHPDEVIALMEECKGEFEDISAEANATDRMSFILNKKFSEKYDTHTAERLTKVVASNLFQHIEGKESLAKLSKHFEPLKKEISQSNIQTFDKTLEKSSLEMGKLAAARKLMRRDPEMLLYSIIDAIQRADQSGQSSESLQLKNELKNYGVTDENLKKALRADSINQRLAAVGLLAKELNFL